MEIFTVRLKEARQEKGWTQKQLAEAINTTDDSIFSWEKGRSQPSIELLRKLCKVLDVSSDYLIGLSD
ncbi:MAG: helix-turn-helix transcriptional regulator [Clostridia bacterium]|nr:helix-turn-helix transcriptional regulator [Clostridia bacterium]